VTSPYPLWRRVSDLLYLRPRFLLLLLLIPPLLWMGIIYLGSLFNLLLYSFYSLNDFTGQIEYRFSTSAFQQLFSSPANIDVIVRTTLMALAVTLLCILIGFPIAYYIAFYTQGASRTFWYLMVLLPLWSSYLVKVYAGRLILAQEGVVSWFFNLLGLGGLLNAILGIPVIAALERVPKSLIQASSDLGAKPGQTFWKVIWPLAIPGVAAGSIFTFSLTLGDYIIPQVVGQPGFFIGQMVYVQQGTAGNLPLAAAFSVVPVVIIAVYLLIVRRLGAFDAL